MEYIQCFVQKVMDFTAQNFVDLQIQIQILKYFNTYITICSVCKK